MLLTCTDANLRLYEPGESTRALARCIPCSELAAMVLEMTQGADTSPERVKDWVNPKLEGLLESLDLGTASAAARELWESRSSFGNVLVYGDYDTDGISSTVLAMEIFRHKAAQVRYFIPRRDVHGYGLNASILDQIAGLGCDTLVVVDCGTNDSEMLASLKSRGVGDIFVFDHHSIASPPTCPTIVNPCQDGDERARQLCATAVLWCWAWKEGILSHDWLRYAIDLVALATISDCMPLNILNRALVRQGIRLMRKNPRRGLGALLSRLGINQKQLSEEQLSMRVIPCLNAPGRIASADIAVRALLGIGNDDAVYGCISDLLRANRRRQTLSDDITREIGEAYSRQHVLFGPSWPVGVLSGVASRICAQRNSPVVLAAPVAGKVRGTLRVPEGGNAVGILQKIAPLLDAWGGHPYAAGFSVLNAHWAEVEQALEGLLSEVSVEEAVIPAISLSPARISLNDWRAVMDLGPFGNDNPCPRFYQASESGVQVEPLGKDGKHSAIRVDNVKLLAFNASPGDLRDISGVKGWVYHPRLNYWRNEEQVQFILDYAVVN